jgi:hypothetical protein
VRFHGCILLFANNQTNQRQFPSKNRTDQKPSRVLYEQPGEDLFQENSLRVIVCVSSATWS